MEANAVPLLLLDGFVRRVCIAGDGMLVASSGVLKRTLLHRWIVPKRRPREIKVLRTGATFKLLSNVESDAIRTVGNGFN